MSDSKPCLIAECAKPSYRRGMCSMHYTRWARHGDPHKVGTRASFPIGAPYKDLHRPGHPLANSRGKVSEHRAVLFGAIGPGPHPCAWCGRAVDWVPKGHPDCLMVDHINGKRDDNRRENLCPSCHTCNATRANQARSDAMRAAGWWARRDTRTNRSPRI